MLQKSIAFLRELIANNHKEWFDKHRVQFEEAKKEFELFIDKLIIEVRLFDPSIGQITSKDCIYRIYRDVRFSHDKTPYKNHFGAYIAQGGRKSILGGYYFHIEPAGSDGFLDQSLWGGGIYCPDAPTLKAIRTDIYENSEDYKAIINAPDFTANFKWFNDGILRSAPKGFPKDFPDIDLIKRKDYTFYKNIEEKTLLSDSILEETISVFKAMLPFNQFVNEAISFAQSE